MNENVSIKEGNITRKFAPIDKLKVDNTDGTSSIWVPEDDLKTGVLYASENGIYIASEDGYDAYSEVVIRVEKRIDDGDLIDESGTDWKDIDFDGDIGNFDELDNWDVDTLEEFSDDLEGFDDLFNDEDKWDEEKEKPITEDEMGDFDGDSISGIDPETGKPVEYSVDEKGFLEEENLPWRIEITRLPERTEFYDGHRIVFSGIEVCAVTDVDGEDAYKPIPYNELIFPVTIASGDDSGVKKVVTDGTDLIGDVYGNGVGVGTIITKWTDPDTQILGMVGDHPYVYAFWEDGEYVSNAIQYVWVASTPWTAELGRVDTFGIVTDRHFISGALRFYNDKPYYIHTHGSFGRMNDFSISDSQWDPEEAAMTASECPAIMEQSVPVQWISPDGSILEDSFTITVLPNPSV